LVLALTDISSLYKVFDMCKIPNKCESVNETLVSKA
jgi:hypothetical protein